MKKYSDSKVAKFLRVLMAYGTNLGMPVVTFFGVFNGAEYAMNVATFICWLTAIAGTLMTIVIMTGEGDEWKKIIDGKVCPLWLDYVCDTMALVFLVMTGAFLPGVAMALPDDAIFVSVQSGVGE